MGLLTSFLENEHLLFADAKSLKKYPLAQLVHDLPDTRSETGKLLAFLYLDDSMASLSKYFSFLRSPHLIALLNDNLGIELKEGLESLYQPAMIIDNQREKITGYEKTEVACSPGPYPLFFNARPSAQIHPNCKLLLSTSGSTGSPKFVKLSEENLLQNALSITAYLPINATDVTPLNLPIYYSYGLSVLHSNALSGGTIVCGTSDVIQREFWTECDSLKFTSIAGVPFIYEMLDRIGFRKKKYPSLRYMTQAGGNLNMKTKEHFAAYCRENTISFFVMYGQTEATARISYVPPEMLQHKPGSIGIPIKNGILEIDPDNGEVLYSGPNVFGGYAEKPEDLAYWDDSGLLRTGDLGEMDNDGYFSITGRMKRFVKLYGNRINLDELERHLKNTAGNTTVATNGIEDKLLLISYSGEDLNEGGLKKQIFELFKIHPTSVRFQKLEEIPLTSNGKVNYTKLLQTYGI